MSEVVEPGDQARGAVLQRPGETEAFVHGNPRDNAWVVFIALDSRGELIDESLLRLRGVLVKVGHLGPDQEAEPIRPIQPAGVSSFWCLRAPLKPNAFASSMSVRRSASEAAVYQPPGLYSWS